MVVMFVTAQCFCKIKCKEVCTHAATLRDTSICFKRITLFISPTHFELSVGLWCVARRDQRWSIYGIKGFQHVKHQEMDWTVCWLMAFSTNTFAANTCSVVFLSALYAAWEVGISASGLSTMCFFMHMAMTFLIIDRSEIGLRFWTGSFGFLGFCIGVIMLSVNSGGCSPVYDIFL